MHLFSLSLGLRTCGLGLTLALVNMVLITLSGFNPHEYMHIRHTAVIITVL